MSLPERVAIPGPCGGFHDEWRSSECFNPPKGLQPCPGGRVVEVNTEAAHDALVSWGDSIMYGPDGYYGSRIATAEIVAAWLGIEQ